MSRGDDWFARIMRQAREARERMQIKTEKDLDQKLKLPYGPIFDEALAISPELMAHLLEERVDHRFDRGFLKNLRIRWEPDLYR